MFEKFNSFKIVSDRILIYKIKKLFYHQSGRYTADIKYNL